jgi:hypothetical protein
MAQSRENPDQIAGADAGGETVGISVAASASEQKNHRVILQGSQPVSEI